MLLVQEYLKIHTFNDLIQDHGVYASLSKNNKKISLNYSQRETKNDDVLSWDCRGLILCKSDYSQFSTVDDKLDLSSVAGDTQILAFGLRRFFNYGQESAANINWSDPKLSILEKADGSLCIVYYDRFVQQWCVATRSVPEADLLMDNGLFTFRILFEKALKETTELSFQDFTKLLQINYTYFFELTTPYNRIVVNYQNNGIILLGARNMDTLLEVYPEQLDFIRAKVVPCVQPYEFNSINELITWVSLQNPSEHEGVIVRDGHFNRIKIKNPAYVVASKIRDSLATSPKNCLELILLGKDDDAAPLLPQEIQNNLLSIKEKYVIWLKEQESLFQLIIKEARAIAPDKKTFALTVQKYKPSMPAALFSFYDGKNNSIQSFIDNNRKDGTWSNSFIEKILSAI
jgi:hypothetical protein